MRFINCVEKALVRPEDEESVFVLKETIVEIRANGPTTTVVVNQGNTLKEYVYKDPAHKLLTRLS